MKKGKFRNITSLVLLLTALLVTTAYAQWSTPVNIAESYGMFSYYQTFAFDNQGKLHFFWKEWDDSPSYIKYSTNKNGWWQRQTVMSGPHVHSPCLHITPDNRMHLLFQNRDGAGVTRTYYTSKLVNDTSWTPTIEITGADGGYLNWAAMDDNGGIYVVTTVVRFNPDRGENYGRYLPYQGSWGSIETIKSSSNKWPAYSFVSHRNNKFYITYTINNIPYLKIRENGVLGQEKQVANSALACRIAAAPNGELCAVYYYDWHIWYRISTNGGTTWSTPQWVSNTSADTYLDRNQGVIYDSFNNLHITWQKIKVEGKGSQLFMKSRIDGVWGYEVDLSTIDSKNKGGGTAYGEHLIDRNGDIHLTFTAEWYKGSGGDVSYLWKPYSSYLPGCGHIQGTVKDQFNNTITGATVEIPALGKNATTNSSGNFIIYNVPEGNHTVSAIKQYYETDTKVVSVTTGQTTITNFTIIQDNAGPEPPASVSANPGSGFVRIRWINPPDTDFKDSMIRVSTIDYPQTPSEGTQIYRGNWPEYVHSGLTNDQIYYYTIFCYDQMNNVSTPTHFMAIPQDPPFENLLLNGSLQSFSSGVATDWTSYKVNDNGALVFGQDSSNVISNPSQSISQIDSNDLPASSYVSSGIYQTIPAVIGNMYLLVGYQDIFTSNYNAAGQRYLHNFGVDPTGSTDPGTPSNSGNIANTSWLASDQTFWNNSKGGSPYYSGFHRATSAAIAQTDTISVWSGLTINTAGTKDGVAAKFNTDQLYLYEFETLVNYSGELTNGSFEEATDLQDNGTVLPDGWIPVGGGIGQTMTFECDAWGAKDGNRGVRIFNRRGVVSAGLMQLIGTQQGTSISFSSYVVRNNSDTLVSVGIDPTGGKDINSPNIVWQDAPLVTTAWQYISVTTQAMNNVATLFLRVKNTVPSTYDGYHTASFDEAEASWTPGTVSAGTLQGTVITMSGNPISGALVQTTQGGYSASTNANGVYTISGVEPGVYTVSASKTGYVTQTNSSVTVVNGSTTISNFSLASTLGSISGTVKDSSNNAISGATVSTNVGGYSATTNANGEYTILDVAAGTYNVTASADGYNPQTNSSVSVSDGVNTVSNFNLNPLPGSITGTVLDDTSNPIAGATISTNIGGYTTTTNSSGVYTLSNVTAGTYNVTASKTNYVSQTNSNVVVSNGAATTSNFNLTPQPGSITGTVQDSASNPISGATVSTNVGGYTTTTNSSGVYTLSNVAVGTYNITASKADYISQTNSNVSVSSNQTTTSNFSLTYSPQERMQNGTFENGFVNTGWGSNCSSQTSRLPGPSGVWDWNNDGTYPFNTWQSTSVKRSGNNALAFSFCQTAASPGKLGIVSQTIDLGSPNATATFSVWAYHNNGNCPSIMAYNPGQNQNNPYTANTNGRLQWVCTDNWGQRNMWVNRSMTVQADSSGFVTIMVGGAAHPGTTSGSRVYIDDVSVVNISPGSITGTVLDGSNNPISGATVETNTGGYTTTTNSSGVYTLNSVIPGTYNITASKTGYQSSTNNNVTVTAAQSTTSNFTLSSGPPPEIVNGNMESGFINTGWGSNCSSQTSRLPGPSGVWGWNNDTSYPFNTWQSTSIRRSGSNALGFSFCQTAASPGKLGIVYQTINLGSANATAVLSVWANHNNGNCPSIMAWNPGANQGNPYTANSAGRLQWVCTDNWGQMNTWVNRTMTVQADSSGYVTIMVGGAAHPGTTSGAKVYIDDVSIVY